MRQCAFCRRKAWLSCGIGAGVPLCSHHDDALHAGTRELLNRVKVIDYTVMTWPEVCELVGRGVGIKLAVTA